MLNAATLETIPAERRGLKLWRGINRDPLHYFTQLANDTGSYAWLSILGRPLLMLNDATGIQHVLQDKAENYRKGRFHKVLEPLFGDSMFLNEGPVWRTRREHAAPVFAYGNFEEMVRQMTIAAEAMFARWQPRVERGEYIDATLEMTRFALDALMRALFHEPRESAASQMRSSLGVILRDAENRVWSGLNLPTFIAYNLPKYKAAQRFLRELVNGLIEARRASAEYPEDLLSRLVEDFGGSSAEHKLLYDEVLSFVLAGHDTTAHGLAWALYNLSLHPEIQRKVDGEVAGVLGDNVPTMESIRKLAYTKQVFDEVLRLFPPVWTMSREAIKDDFIPLDDGSQVRIPANAGVMMCHYTVHRRETYWPNPEAFDPDRFDADSVKARPKYAWFPFGGGPRMCLGFRFAQVESVLALAMISQRYKISLVPGQRPEPEPIITLRPAGSILFKVIPKPGFQSRRAEEALSSVIAMEESGGESEGRCPFHSAA
jgi:cytochrome P450